MAQRADFVSVAVLDKRAEPLRSRAKSGPSKRALLRGLLAQAPFVAKNFRLYFRNGWRRHILRTKVVAPYAVTFYVTHKCNLDCSYCTQKEPDVFSDELGTRDTLQLLRRIRKESDSIVITGGEPTLRSDIEEIVAAARFACKFRSVLLITNGTLLDRKPGILRGVTGFARRDRVGGQFGCAGGRPHHPAVEAGGVAEGDGESRFGEGTARRASHHHQYRN